MGKRERTKSLLWRMTDGVEGVRLVPRSPFQMENRNYVFVGPGRSLGLEGREVKGPGGEQSLAVDNEQKYSVRSDFLSLKGSAPLC